jgi:hypothetical protein
MTETNGPPQLEDVTVVDAPRRADVDDELTRVDRDDRGVRRCRARLGRGGRRDRQGERGGARGVEEAGGGQQSSAP